MGRIFVQIVVISTLPTLPDVHQFPIPVHRMMAVPLEKTNHQQRVTERRLHW